MTPNRIHPHIFQFLLFIFFIVNTSISYCQTNTEQFIKISDLNDQIQNIQSKIDRADLRLIQLKNEQSTDIAKLNYIQNIEKGRQELILQKTTLENTKITIINSSEKKKEQINKIDFDSFSDEKRKRIIENPDKYEILN